MILNCVCDANTGIEEMLVHTVIFLIKITTEGKNVSKKAKKAAKKNEDLVTKKKSKAAKKNENVMTKKKEKAAQKKKEEIGRAHV